MPAKIEYKKKSKLNEIQDSLNHESPFGGLVDQSESEMKWVQLHQMFDK